MAQLAIKGNETRGKEVIQLLEMLGGANAFNLDGAMGNYYYYIDNVNDRIYHCLSINPKNCIIYTLEEFEKLYPYKVGDKISSKYLKNYKIEKMEWEDTNNKIIYKLQGMGWYNTNELQPYKEETMGERENSVVVNVEHKQLKVHSLMFDKTQLMINDKYELVQEGNAYYIVCKKTKYPKTYIECAKILNCFSASYIDGYKNELLEKLQALLICRDAYLKIAGEEMGLGEPWEPDWCSELDLNYTIIYNGMYTNKIDGTGRYALLAFPTKEMRDAFYENFKELIEECKELL